jgi:hypothetical protein
VPVADIRATNAVGGGEIVVDHEAPDFRLWNLSSASARLPEATVVINDVAAEHSAYV